MHIFCPLVNLITFFRVCFLLFQQYLVHSTWLNLAAGVDTEAAHNDVMHEQKVGKFGQDFGLIRVISVEGWGCQIQVNANPTINTKMSFFSGREAQQGESILCGDH